MYSSIDKNFRAKAKSYPYLGEFQDGMVVLFTEPELGVVVHVGKIGDYSLGEMSDSWAEEDVKPFEGHVFLHN